MKINHRRFFFSGGPQGRVAISQIAIVLAASTLIGCTSTPPTTQPVSEDQRQDEILKHPDDYKLNMNHDIGGGGIGESRGLGTDIDHVLNP